MSLEELLNVRVTSATRHEESSFRLPSMVTVLTREQLSTWGAQNLADGLKIASGVMSRKHPGDFPQYVVAVRGNVADFLNTRTLFLIDGVPLRNPNAGLDPAWIPLAMIDRVEIVKGPISSLYGANAFGGVINVITRSGTGANRVEAEAGARLRKDAISNRVILGHTATVNIGGQTGNLSYFLSAQHFRDHDSPTTYSGSAYQDVFGKLSYRAGASTVLTLRSLLSFDRNQIATTSGTGPIRNNLYHFALSSETKLGEHTKLQLTAYTHHFNHYLDYIDDLVKYENDASTYGVTSLYSTRLGTNHRFVAGAEYTDDTGLLDTNAHDFSTFPPAVEPAGWSSKTQHTYGVYVQDQYTGWARFLPLLGLRFDHNSVSGSALSPRAGLSYAILDTLSVYGTAGRAFRAPVFNENYIHGFGKVGNTALKPELTTTYEMGLKSVQQSMQHSIAFFHQDIFQRIDFEPISPSGPNTDVIYRNVGRGTIQGVELEGTFSLLPGLRAFYNATFLSTDNGSGQRIETATHRKIVVWVKHTWAGWEFKYSLVHEGDQFFYNSNSQVESDSEGRVWRAPITTLNFHTSKKWSSWGGIELFVNNLTDRRYKEAFSDFLIQDGAWMPRVTLGTTLTVYF